MKSSVAITIDDVLRKRDGHPLPEGIRLYKTLGTMYNLVLFADEPELTEELEYFFSTEQLDEHSLVAYGPGPRVNKAYSLRNRGFALDFIVEADPSISSGLMAHGFNVLHFMHAKYTRPDWRPDHQQEIAPWEELVKKELQDRVSKAADKRLQ